MPPCNARKRRIMYGDLRDTIKNRCTASVFCNRRRDRQKIVKFESIFG